MESFAGLNVHGFNPTKVFTEMLSTFLNQKWLLFSIINQRCFYIHRKTFTVHLKTVKTQKFSPVNLSICTVYQCLETSINFNVNFYRLFVGNEVCNPINAETGDA